jgi:Methylmalonic aciduria and homocystinuria type D protein
MQYSVHLPSRYIYTHQNQLLPDWSLPASSLLIVLQRCRCNLLEQTTEAELQKNWLRREFLKLGGTIVMKLNRMGYLADLFDPRTGLPVLSTPGQLRIDDVAIAHAILGYPVHTYGGCSVILHPHWGSSVYPSTLISSAQPLTLQQVVEDIMNLTISNTVKEP